MILNRIQISFFLENINEKLIAVYIEQATHHLDLRSSNENDQNQ
jgi:hypothetical protein